VPSVLHQAPLVLLEERPDLLLALLGRPVGDGERVAMQSPELTQTLPVERRADAVITIEKAEAITAAFVVEVQLAVDDDKRFTWPFYAAAVHARFRCPTSLVVLAATSDVATWARGPMPSFGHGAWSPCVFGPEEIPRITSLEEARRNPELAVLSAITHGREPEGGPILEATLLALARLDAPQRDSYTDLLHALLGELARAAIEALMPLADNPFKGSLQRAFIEHAHLKGTLEGRLAECRKNLLAIFAERGLGPSEAGRARVEAEGDLETLERWVRRAVSAATEDAVFAPA
jgi:hypothetical protein